MFNASLTFKRKLYRFNVSNASGVQNINKFLLFFIISRIYIDKSKPEFFYDFQINISFSLHQSNLMFSDACKKCLMDYAKKRVL